MKPFFIKSSVEKVRYLRGEYLENKPVNLIHCKSIEKNNYKWYPDNNGKPSIKFNGCEVEWVYDDVQTRDEDFNRIVDSPLIVMQRKTTKY